MSALVDEILRNIRDARRVLAPIIHRTHLDHSLTFSRMTGGDIYLKLENLQNLIYALPPPLAITRKEWLLQLLNLG